MPFIPHTEQDTRAMLASIGVAGIEDLFDEVPGELRSTAQWSLPPALSEMEITRLMAEQAASNPAMLCFTGAGAYEHHIPAAVWELVSRGEFYTGYTPYQAEASQGTLQTLYEYQTMMANLTAMDVSNTSLYDGASSLAEAVLMAVRANRATRSKRVLMPCTVNPVYRRVVQTITCRQGIEVDYLPYDKAAGNIDPASLPASPGDFAALVIPQPNFLGVLEEVGPLTDWAHTMGALVIGVVNPLAMALLNPPGQWGSGGADIACGEGQPLGIPLSCGGPYFGFMCCKKPLVRQMPGRIVGRTVDREGKTGFALTLQAREQHIRRSKATSNICTNQGLMVTAATIHMALLGAEGLRRVALASHANTLALLDRLTAIDGISRPFSTPFFHEAVLHIEDVPVKHILMELAAENVLGGYSLEDEFPELGPSLLVCTTETKTDQDLDNYARRVHRIIRAARPR